MTCNKHNHEEFDDDHHNAIGSARCIISPVDGDCALGFRCMEFTSSSIADKQFASLICPQLKI